jgi:hypothetical protein
MACYIVGLGVYPHTLIGSSAHTDDETVTKLTIVPMSWSTLNTDLALEALEYCHEHGQIDSMGGVPAPPVADRLGCSEEAIRSYLRELVDEGRAVSIRGRNEKTGRWREGFMPIER